MTNDNNNDTLQQDAKHLLETIEQVEETLAVMSQVVHQLKQQVATQALESPTKQTADEDLSRCDNLNGVWH